MALLYSTVNDKPVTYNQLQMIPTPPPLGSRHMPYPFAQYVDDIHLALDNAGIEVAEQEFAVTKDHNRLFGLMRIEAKPLEGELIKAKDWDLLLGLRGSHDQRIPRGMVLGSRVMCCSNLQMTGDLASFHTKQTLEIAARLPGLIREAVGHIPQMAEQQERQFDAYKAFEMNPRHGDAALVEIFRRDGLSSAQLGRAINQWHEPNHEEHTENGFTAWRLLNAVTESLKPTGGNFNALTMAERSQIATGFLNEFVTIQ